MTTPQSYNLMQLNEAISAQTTDQLYMVRDNQDRRVSAETLLRLVNAAWVGLDQVDNTPDLEKPISMYQQQALDQKQDLQEAQEQYQELVDSLASRVDQQTFTEAIQNLQQALDSKLSSEGLTTAVESALAPFQSVLDELSLSNTQILAQLANVATTAYVDNAVSQLNATIQPQLTAFSSQLTTQGQQLTAIQEALPNFATRAYVNTQIELLAEQTDQRHQQLEMVVNALDGSVTSALERVDQIEAAVANKADQEHNHAVAEIIGLEEMLGQLAEDVEHPVELGPMEW
jgi:hypothetical protein